MPNRSPGVSGKSRGLRFPLGELLLHRSTELCSTWAGEEVFFLTAIPAWVANFGCSLWEHVIRTVIRFHANLEWHSVRTWIFQVAGHSTSGAESQLSGRDLQCCTLRKESVIQRANATRQQLKRSLHFQIILCNRLKKVPKCSNNEINPPNLSFQRKFPLSLGLTDSRFNCLTFIHPRNWTNFLRRWVGIGPKVSLMHTGRIIHGPGDPWRS